VCVFAFVFVVVVVSLCSVVAKKVFEWKRFFSAAINNVPKIGSNSFLEIVIHAVAFRSFLRVDLERTLRNREVVADRGGQ